MIKPQGKIRKNFFRIVMWKGERGRERDGKKIAASTCQRNVVRQLKIKFIVLDLKSHKNTFLTFNFTSLLFHVWTWSRLSRNGQGEKPETNMKPLWFAVIKYSKLFSILFKCIPYTIECHSMPGRLLIEHVCRRAEEQQLFSVFFFRVVLLWKASSRNIFSLCCCCCCCCLTFIQPYTRIWISFSFL